MWFHSLIKRVSTEGLLCVWAMASRREKDECKLSCLLTPPLQTFWNAIRKTELHQLVFSRGMNQYNYAKGFITEVKLITLVYQK